MDKIDRLRLGIIFNSDPRWMGGVIYILNIVKVLGFLEDADKPHIFLFYDRKLEKFLDEITYPYMDRVPWTFIPVYRGFTNSFIKRRNVFICDMIDKYRLEVLFPNSNFPVKTRSNAKVISWTADLQHKYYPEFFSKRKRIERNLRIRFKLKNASELVVSSQASKDDFYRFFKVPESLNIHVYHFVSVINDLPENNIDVIRSKYRLPNNYYLVSNQFHKHKNHIVVFRALSELKANGINKHFAITGKLPEEPDSEYMIEIQKIIDKEKLGTNISFLGLIPRSDQLMLMKYANAIVQPSLFEGWSTVIEDAKSLQVPVIASNLPVNIEQLKEKGTFFNPCDHSELAGILENYPVRNFSKKIYEDYSSRMKAAAYELMKIFDRNSI
ncbi:MAG: glycosyltransferase family 4 protein [Bacteroidales bacterium]|nr:glycosyltransferase family 4 protein [Bacteroidales bacterium]